MGNIDLVIMDLSLYYLRNEHRKLFFGDMASLLFGFDELVTQGPFGPFKSHFFETINTNWFRLYGGVNDTKGDKGREGGTLCLCYHLINSFVDSYINLLRYFLISCLIFPSRLIITHKPNYDLKIVAKCFDAIVCKVQRGGDSDCSKTYLTVFQI